MTDELYQMINLKQWYHVIEVAPGIRTPGRYDPRPLLDTMGFPKDLTGKTVLDIGCYDGFFSFEAKRRGANEAKRRGAKRVLAIDLIHPDDCGFNVARELLGLEVKHQVCSVYDLSPEIHGTFDIVLFMGVLYHLRHPLLAIDKIHDICTEYMILETHVVDNCFLTDSGEEQELQALNPTLLETPLLRFYPDDELGADPSNWFGANIACVKAMLRTSGFRPELMGSWGDRAAFIANREEFVTPPWY